MKYIDLSHKHDVKVISSDKRFWNVVVLKPKASPWQSFEGSQGAAVF